MHKDLLSEIDLFLNDRIDLWDFIGELTYYSTINFNSINNAIHYMENKEDDDSLIVSLLLWSIENSPFKDLSSTSNSFYKFLLSLKSTNDSFYKSKIDWLFNDKHICIYQKEDLLFLVNSSKDDKCVELPKEYCYQTLECLNCNEEFNVECILEIPSKSFYIITKNKN